MNYKKTLVVSPAFYPQDRMPREIAWMQESATMHGIEIELFGVDQLYINNFDAKIVRLWKAFKDRQEYEHILMVDSADVLFATGLGELHYRFAQMKAPFVMSAEKNCYPHERYRHTTPEAHKPFRYLNSGAYLATWDAFLRQFGDLLAKLSVLTSGVVNGDQGAWQLAWMEGCVQLKLDTDCKLFQSFCQVSDHWSILNKDIAWGKRPYNRITDTYPCVLHFNGESKRMMGGVREMLLL